MKSIGMALLILALTTVSLSASDCYSGSSFSYYRSYYTPYYTPTYYTYPPTLNFSSGGADQSDLIKTLTAAVLKATADTNRAKDDQILLLKQLLAAGGSVPPEMRAAMAPPHPGLVLARETCIKCHGGDGVSGGKHVFFNGDTFVGTPKDLENMRDRLENGTMPPRTKWDWDRKGPVLSWFTRMKIAGDSPPPVETKKLPTE